MVEPGSPQPTTTAAVRGLLVRARAQALARLEALTADFEEVVGASRDTNADDEHDPEGSTIAFERAQLGALGQQARDRVAELDAALDRLAAGTYGRCERCGGAIADARLEARPEARTCMACAGLRS